MRLVDVEPFDFISFHATGDTAYDQGFEDGVRFVAEKIDAAPTIDAIPVEWIIKWSNKQYRETQADVSIVDVLAAWRKEQGAQDGGHNRD